MAKLKKSGGQFFDRQVFWLLITVFVGGLVLGFFFGKKSSEIVKSLHPVKKISAETPKKTAQKAAPKREVKVEEIKREGKNTREVSIAPIPVTVKKKENFLSIFKKSGPKIAVVIDDVGNDLHLEELLWSLPNTVTLAILPQLPYSTYYAKEGKKRGYPIILHQPLEPIKEYGRQDKGMILTEMTDWEIVDVLTKNLESVPTAEGINNHKGSKATQDARVMKIILNELKQRQLFYFDSMTSLYSVGWKIAKALKVPSAQRDVFLDNETEADYIHGQIEELSRTAKKTGAAIGIGHYKSSSLGTLIDEIKRLEGEGFIFVPLKELVK